MDPDEVAEGKFTSFLLFSNSVVHLQIQFKLWASSTALSPRKNSNMVGYQRKRRNYTKYFDTKFYLQGFVAVH